MAASDTAQTLSRTWDSRDRRESNPIFGDRKLKLRKYEIVKRGEEIYVVA